MDVQCKTDPRAPHGFLRNASHCEDRYVCECEYWESETVDKTDMHKSDCSEFSNMEQHIAKDAKVAELEAALARTKEDHKAAVLKLARYVIRNWAYDHAKWSPSNEQCDALLLELGINNTPNAS